MKAKTNDKINNNNYKYIPIKLLGEGSYGKAYLVEYTSNPQNTKYSENIVGAREKVKYFFLYII